MKKILWMLIVVSALTSCAEEKTPTAQFSAEEMGVLKTCTDPVEFVPPGGQEMAIDAYESIIASFGTPLLPDDPGYPGYPEEFANAYIGEDYFLYVCLTDISGAVRKKYCSVVDEPNIVRILEVEHSYQDLYDLQMAMVRLDGWEFTSIGINVRANRVDIGIPDISSQAQVRELFEEKLTSDILDRFEDLPLSFLQEEYITLN